MDSNQERFSAATTYNEQAYRALVLVTMNHLRKWPRILLILTGIVSVLAPGIYMVMTGQVSFMPMLLVFTGNWVVFIGAFAPRIATRMLVANNRKGVPPVVQFTFYSNRFQVENQDKLREYTYQDVQRVFETMGYLIFFFRDKQVDLLRQEDVEGGSAEDFRDFLNTKLSGGAHGLGTADRKQV